MKFGTQGGRFVLLAGGRVLDVHEASGGDLPWEPLAALGRWDDLSAFAASADWAMGGPLDESRLGPPVPCPRQVFAVALNYRPHAAEAGFVPPEAPLVFTKFPTCIAGPRRRRRRDPPALRGKEPCVSATRPLHVLIAGGGLR